MENPKRVNPQVVSSLDTMPGEMPDALNDADAAAEQEAAAMREANTGAYTLRLSKPLQWEGRTYEALTFQWDTLTGMDHLEIENELLAKGKTLVVPEYTGDYLCGMAVRAMMECKELIPPQRAAMLKRLPLGDFMNMCKEARSFLSRARRQNAASDAGSESNA